MAAIFQTENDIAAFLFNLVTNPFFIIAVVFWAAIAALVVILGRLKKSKALSVFFPFLAMLKTTRLNRLLGKIARKSPRTWKLIFTAGIFVSFAFTVYGFWWFISNLVTLLTHIENPDPSSQVTPIVPGLTIDFNTFLYLIIPILFVLTVHEFAHAISANADGIPVKSTGVLGMGMFFIIGFGAFVEVDEKAYKRGKFTGWQKTRLAAAGSFSNAILAGIALVLLVNFTSVVSLSWSAPGLTIHSVLTASEGGHNEGVLFAGDVVFEINGTRMADIDLDLTYYLTEIATQNDTLDLLILRNNEYIHVLANTGPPPPGYNQSIAYMGIRSGGWWWPPRDWLGSWLGPNAPNTLYAELFWLFQIALSVTIFNMMPLPIFDGDKCVYEVINHFIKPRKEKKDIKERFLLSKGEKTCELRPVNIEGVLSVVLLPGREDPDGAVEELAEHHDYQVADSDGDGKIDHVTFELCERDLAGREVEVEYTAEVDATEGKKRVIMNVIRVVSLVVILLNFIVSGITLGFTMPFG
ncbi:MAG: site-2 protease family protein [Candidatus Lokiarchaeota archaeon]|nr:site-2 protease family protein [Candidatus Lokiarchaeota archaeon]